MVSFEACLSSRYHKQANMIAKFSGQWCDDFQLNGCLSIQTTAIWRPLGHSSMSQAQETSPRKDRPVNEWEWYTCRLLIHWCSNWAVVKKYGLPFCVWKLASVKSGHICGHKNFLLLGATHIHRRAYFEANSVVIVANQPSNWMLRWHFPKTGVWPMLITWVFVGYIPYWYMKHCLFRVYALYHMHTVAPYVYCW